MKPVEQVYQFDAETGERGDCLRACIASILELERDEVPHFVGMGDRWWTEWMNFLHERGWAITQWSCGSGQNERPSTYRSEGYWLGVVKSPRLPRPCESCGGQGWILDSDEGRECPYCGATGTTYGTHMVVMEGREIVWDPHPKRADGHMGFVEGYALVAIDPARFVLKDAA
jgi:hypothetical protein